MIHTQVKSNSTVLLYADITRWRWLLRTLQPGVPMDGIVMSADDICEGKREVRAWRKSLRIMLHSAGYTSAEIRAISRAALEGVRNDQ